ncbi:MAG: glutamine--fructose-6-phosphate transaminase (isomerizing) [Candidatus Lokiarchaeota archaeon]|nr:glutamine--fructose-6-phosphate transaminase (isomerizing) [Candidatus Lokiarchaeota archaeon]
MCGIFGIITNQDIEIGKLALEGIKRLEYRGYDSCGIVSQHEGKLHVKKDAGKINAINKKLGLDDLPGKIALAHTRWATHGAPTKINSHPHFDCSEKIAVVHNGIIENFLELKERLISKGHVFKSDTDTEVIPHLIEEYEKRGLNFQEAVFEALRQCEGGYGAAICHADCPDKIIVVRKESPLVIGIEDGKTTYCASDIPAFLPHTRKHYVLGDDELAVLRPGEVDFYDIKTKTLIEKSPKTIDWSVDAAEKGGYDHFMLKEIFEQPQALKRTLSIPLESLRSFAESLITAKTIYITAAGTSFYASLAGKFIISKFLGIHIQEIECSEFQTQLSDCLEKNSVIIALSQSGETIDTIEAIRWAKESADATILSITNVVGSSITRYSDHTIITRAGPEIGVAATKTYTAQVLTLAMIGLEIARIKNLESSEDIKSYKKALNEVPNIIEKFLNHNIEHIKKIMKGLEKIKFKKIKKLGNKDLGKKLNNKHNFFFLARGISIATAKEGGLKMKEVACRFIEGYSAAHAKHGPISLVRGGFPIIFIAPPDDTYTRLIGNVAEFKARGGKIISLVVESDETISEMSDITIRIPQPADRFHNLFSPITFIPALQLLAYYAALDAHLDPDQPRNLAKTVTVH